MKTLTNRLSQNKYKLLMILLLALASAVAVIMEKAHVAYSHENDFPSLVRNLMLAWIPLVFASMAYGFSWSRKLVFLIVPLFAFVWLIFFPNAPYMLTEFQHLRLNAATAPLWYDVLMLIWFAWIGLLLGIYSLYLMQEIVARIFRPTVGWLFTLAVTVLSSVGIYLGRFLRWNSWDILQDPKPIAKDIWGWFRHPGSNLSAYGFTIVFTFLFLFVYLAFYTFSKVVQERKAEEKGK